MITKCLWCLSSEPEVTFEKKAHTIPKSLGGQNFNRNVCDNCNEYFGNRDSNNSRYSIEEALKETFVITRKRLLNASEPKRKVGRFRSKFFEIKERNGKPRLSVKSSFRFSKTFQVEICRAFKRGLYKMFLEELNRQRKLGYEENYNIIRDYARNNIGELPVFYFYRKFGVMLLLENEAETPTLLFDRMNYLYCNDKFMEIEFLGHVFGFPISIFNEQELQYYISESMKNKRNYFKGFVIIERLIDVDLMLEIMND